MTRTLPVIACALLAGCATSPPRRAIVPVPGHGVTVFWTIDAACRDVLEMTADLNSGQWAEVAGPYPALDTGGLLEYRVTVTGNAAQSFFRIRRDWGNPWVITPKIETKIEVQK